MLDRADDASGALDHDAARVEFVTHVTHELRTPLTTISGYLEVLGEAMVDHLTAEHAQMLGTVQRNVHRLRNLIDDLLAVTCAEKGPETLERCDLGALAQDAAGEVRTTEAAARNVQLSIAVSGRPQVEADPEQLRRALGAVFSNAVRFSADQGRVEVDVTSESGRGVVRVQDHGIGIPAEEIELIRTPFYRASNAVRTSTQGGGLGLALASHVIDHLDGAMEFESKVGQGTKVVIEIPLVG